MSDAYSKGGWDHTAKELLAVLDTHEQVSVAVGTAGGGFLRVRITKVEARRLAKKLGEGKVRVAFDGGMIMIGTGAFRWEPGTPV